MASLMKFDIAGAFVLRCTGVDRNRDFGMNKRVMMKFGVVAVVEVLLSRDSHE